MREIYANAFKLLHLDPNADKERIRHAYKRRVQQLHPDRDAQNSTAQKQQEFQDVLNAYKLISEALDEGALAPRARPEPRVEPEPEAAPEDDSPRPFSANSSLRQQVATDHFYQTTKPVSAVKFVGAIVLFTAAIVIGFASFAAWQKSTTAGRQWDPTYHENKVRGISEDSS